MSWTISSHVPHSKEIKDLESEVQAAGKDNILMFASASDQGENNNEHLYPGNSEGAGCVRVGAASNEGDRLPWVNPEWSEYSVPGKEIGFRDHETGSYFTETGSSLANACAAGLAGALLYCDRLLGGAAGKWDLRSSENMKKMLNGLSQSSNQNHKLRFIDVRSLLEQPFKKKLEKEGLKQNGVPPQIEQLNWGPESKRALAQVLDIVWERFR